jgi:hypothetical protein
VSIGSRGGTVWSELSRLMRTGSVSDQTGLLVTLLVLTCSAAEASSASRAIADTLVTLSVTGERTWARRMSTVQRVELRSSTGRCVIFYPREHATPGPSAANGRGDPNLHRREEDVLLVPAQQGQYKVLCFHHGTALLSVDYLDLLTRVCEQGFIVFAPQLYRPWQLLTTPVSPLELRADVPADRWKCLRGMYEHEYQVDKERRLALSAQSWALSNKLQDILPSGVRADTATGLFVGGHSRGGGIAWLTAQDRQGDAPVAGE